MNSVSSTLSYLKSGRLAPYSYTFTPPTGTPWESGEYESINVDIADARHGVSGLSIHQGGFELRDAPTSVANFMDSAAVRQVYYPEAIELALAVTGGARAYIFDHLVRRREENRSALSFGRLKEQGPPAANGRIHNDYTEASGQRRLALVLDEPGIREKVRRYCIINIWRSIRGPVLDTPLAVCDARTVRASDFVASEVRYPNRIGEIYLATHSPHHRWFYFSKMDRHEAMIFKQYDSQISGVARFTPHAAFDLPDVPPNAPLRESIELRCLVVFDE